MAIDPLIERDNAHLAAVRRACDAARAEARTLVEAEDVVSKLGGWCKRVLFGSVDVKFGRDGQDRTDSLTLPPDQSALQSFAHLPAGSSRQSLEFGLQAVLDNGEHAQKNVLAWLFGQALANALVEELSKESNPVKHVLPRIWDLAGSRDLLYAAFVETFPKLLCKRLIPLHPVTQYEGATQLSVGERGVGRESALCVGHSRIAPLRA